MSGAKTTSFLDAVMAEAISLSDANKITLSAAAQDAIKGSESISKRHKREQIAFDVPPQSGQSSSWDNDAAHLEYLHSQINKERTIKEKAEASLDTSQENLRIVSEERDKAVYDNNNLSSEMTIISGKINGLISVNKTLVQEIEAITTKHNALLDSQQESLSSMSSKLLEESCEHIVAASSADFKKAFLQATTGIDAEVSVPTEVKVSMDSLRKGSSSAMQVHSFRLPKKIFVALITILANASSSIVPSPLPLDTFNITASASLGPSFSDRSYINPSGRHIAKWVYLDTNKVFKSARSALKFANEINKEHISSSKSIVPSYAQLVPFVDPVVFPTSDPDAPAPISSNAPGKRRVGSPTRDEPTSPKKDIHALSSDQFDIVASNMGVPDVIQYFDNGLKLIIAQEGSFPARFIPLRNALIQNGLQNSSPSRRAPEIQAAVLKSKLLERIDPISFTISEQDESEKEINLILPIIKFVSDHTAVGYESWMHGLFNGKEEFERTSKTERDRAMRTQLHNFGGPKGANLATLRNAIEYAIRWHEECGYDIVFPMPGAYVANMAEDKRLASKSFAASGALTVPYKFKSIMDSAQEKLKFPGNKGVAIATIKKSKSARSKKTKPLPIALMEGMQKLASDESIVLTLPALAYTAAHGDIIVSGSSRDVDHMRTTVLDDFEHVKGADAVFNIEVTKSKGETNTKFALKAVGIRQRKLGYLQKGSTFRKIFKSLGCCPELVDASGKITNDILLAVSMRKRTKSVKPNTLQKQFTERLYQLWSYLGLSETKRKANGITGHSPHSTFNCVAKQLKWSESQCARLGRWSFSTSTGYADHAAACDQLVLRSNIVHAINDLYPTGDFPMEPTFDFLGGNMDITASKFYGVNFRA